MSEKTDRKKKFAEKETGEESAIRETGEDNLAVSVTVMGRDGGDNDEQVPDDTLLDCKPPPPSVSSKTPARQTAKKTKPSGTLMRVICMAVHNADFFFVNYQLKLLQRYPRIRPQFR